MMTKKLVFAAALLSLAVSISCSSAHNPQAAVGVSVQVQNGLAQLFYSQAVQVTATVTGTGNTAVTWSLQDKNGGTCSDPNTCGTLSSTTANPVTYTAPGQAEPPVTIVATSQADTSKTDSVTLTISVSLQVAPYASGVGAGLTQQFTAVTVPDDADQTVDWSISNCTSGPCGSIDANGLYNAAGANPGAVVTVQASSHNYAATVGTTIANVVSSRLTGGATYAFQFSGFDANTKLALASAGNFSVANNGTSITGGTWDEVTSGGPAPCTFSSGSFTAVSNNQGKLSLTGSCNGSPRSLVFNVVFDAAGDIQMIEADGNRTGSGVIQLVTGNFKNLGSLKGNFVFGLTGVDVSTRARTGYVGLLPMDGSGTIGGGGIPGLMDLNDGGANTGAASNVTGTYTLLSSGIYSVTINSTLGTFNFHLYGVSGQSSGNNPATLYAISTDGKPGVSGTAIFQGSLKGDNTDLSNTSVLSLTGSDNGGSNVSLTLLSPDKKGNLSGSFDQNDAGTVQTLSSFSNTYSATGSGRLTINLPVVSSGNPKSTSFVLYLSATNQGFLLDQSSASVITGTMTPQVPVSQKDLGAVFAASELPSTFAAAVQGAATSSVDPTVANLLVTWVNTGNCTSQCVNGFQWDGSQNPTGSGTALSGTYTLGSNGAGGPSAGGSSIVFTQSGSNQPFVIYMIDIFDYLDPTKHTSHFLMFEEDTSQKNPAIIDVRQ